MAAEGGKNVNPTASFVRMSNFVTYRNGCLSTMNYYPNGTLLVWTFKQFLS